MPPRLCFFPGLGCDGRIIDAHRSIHARIEDQLWIEPLRRESLAHYARRMAQAIDTSTPFYLAGISLGGMVALEAARALAPSGNVCGVILIAACRSRSGVPIAYRTATWFAGRSPLWLVRLGKRVMPHMRRLFGIREAEQVDLFERVLADADPAFIRWSLRAVIEWPGVEPGGIPVFQIHGRRDHVLPLRTAGAVDRVVDGAGHALNITHARQVNAAIDQWLAGRSCPAKSAPV